MNQAKKKVTVYDLINNTESNFKLDDGDSLDDENSATIVPNKGMVVVSNKDKDYEKK